MGLMSDSLEGIGKKMLLIIDADNERMRQKVIQQKMQNTTKQQY